MAFPVACNHKVQGAGVQAAPLPRMDCFIRPCFGNPSDSETHCGISLFHHFTECRICSFKTLNGAELSGQDCANSSRFGRRASHILTHRNLSVLPLLTARMIRCMDEKVERVPHSVGERNLIRFAGVSRARTLRTLRREHTRTRAITITRMNTNTDPDSGE